MKTKDMVIIGFCGIIMIGAIYFAFNMLFPKQAKTNQPTVTTVSNEPTITGKIDEETLNKLKTFKNYGEGTLENIGRVNPFSPIK